MYDPYTGKQKRKRGESAVPEGRSPCCLVGVAVLMILAMLVGAAAALIFIGNPRETKNEHATETRFAVVINQTATQDAIFSSTPPTQTPTVTRTASPTPSASPTARSFVEVTATRPAPVPTVTPIPPGTIAASQGRPSGGFEFFAQSSGFPRLVEPINLTCIPTQTGFTLDFRQAAGVDNVYYFEVALQANGDGASLAEVTPLLPDNAIFPEEVILTVNESSLAASELGPDETLLSAYDRMWEREQRGIITSFSVTWINTNRQPNLDFEVLGLHPNGGNILMTISWAFSPDRPLESSGAFQVCS